MLKLYKKLLSSFSLPQIVLTIGLCIVLILNCIAIGKDLSKYQKIKPILKNQFIGYKFSGLENILKDTKKIGYYTDKNLNDPINNKQLSQAQFVLAPTIIDVSNLNHKYVLFDCSSKEVAFDKMKKIKAKPFKKNKFGIILAVSSTTK